MHQAVTVLMLILLRPLVFGMPTKRRCANCTCITAHAWRTYTYTFPGIMRHANGAGLGKDYMCSFFALLFLTLLKRLLPLQIRAAANDDDALLPTTMMLKWPNATTTQTEAPTSPGSSHF